MKQMEIDAKINKLIPENLLKKFKHLSYLEMSDERELSEYSGELIQAENDWFEAEDPQ